MLHSARLLRVALLGIVYGAAGAAAQSVNQPTRPAIDPVAIAIFERHLAATVPSKPFKYTHLVAEMSSGNGPATRLERFSMRPDKLVTHTTIPGFGTIRTGFDGKIGWSLVPRTGATLLEGDQLTQFRATGDNTSKLAIGNFVALASVGRDTLDGRVVDAVFGVSANGDSVTYYVDIESGLLAGLRARRAGGQVADTGTVMLFADYERLSGSLVATRITTRVSGRELVLRTIQFDHDAIDAAIFTVPKVVQAMLKRRQP